LRFASIERLRELKAQFDAAHQHGMKALKDRNYAALDAAIQAEKAILEEQSLLLLSQQAEIAEKLKRGRMTQTTDHAITSSYAS
jgi:hypothetical protein